MLVRRQNINDWSQFDLFNSFERLGLEINKLCGFPFHGFRANSTLEEENLCSNLFTDGNDLIFRSSIPGVAPEQISVNVKDNVLSIEAERESEETDETQSKYFRRERLQSRFHGTVTLPEGAQVDKVSAEYKDGILTVRVPRAEKPQPKQIYVSCE
ncbi:MAG: Hsp20/alpha crystallin family protein [Limisphaerales bacterium]|jgi:HSP20 family protein|nr:Hsp20/alpha crystallin family protein [Verrucomicrobiota bacterium]